MGTNMEINKKLPARIDSNLICCSSFPSHLFYKTIIIHYIIYNNANGTHIFNVIFDKSKRKNDLKKCIKMHYNTFSLQKMGQQIIPVLKNYRKGVYFSRSQYLKI